MHPGSLVSQSTAMLRIEQIARLRLMVLVMKTYVGAIKSGVKVAFAATAFLGQRFGRIIGAVGDGAALGMAAAMACVVALGCHTPATPTLIIATTTSVQNSGLLEALLPHFTSAIVQAHATGSGRALEMLAKGDVALVISHAPDAESRYLAEHGDWVYQKLAFNRFVIAGPAGDPVAIAGWSSAIDAFRRIASSPSTFVSRGDGSGTHEREQQLWALAGTQPPPDRLVISGRGMAQALRHADEKQAYLLADEATFWQLDDQLDLAILVDGDPVLLNTYAVIHDGDPLAVQLAEWLSRGDGRRGLIAHRVAGRPAFTAWPESCPAATPAALPCLER